MNHSVLEAAAIDYRELRAAIWTAAIALYSPDEATVAQVLDAVMAYVPEDKRFRLRDAVDRAVFNYSNHVADHCIELALVSARRQQALAQQRAWEQAAEKLLQSEGNSNE